ncbi:MAG: DUF368 domain-containing protein [Treponema sp.]|nr:DUF368 domain-containing protein [Treponema sp.]
MEFVKLTAIGFVLGITAIIPGFSVATMAVVFNVYDRLINVIVPNVKKILAAWLFWLPLIIGGAAGLFFFSKVFTVLFDKFNIPTYWFFIGVIAGSIPLIYSRVCDHSQEQKGLKLPSLPVIICFVIAVGVMVFIAIIKPEEGAVVYTELTLHVFGLIVLAGVLSAIAMIVPGISGAFILLVIGFYRTILQAVSELNIPLILPFILGAIIGLLVSAAFVRFLLLKAPRQTYGAVLGLVAGSILVLFPGGFGSGTVIIASVICLITGFALSFIFSRQKKEIKSEE